MATKGLELDECVYGFPGAGGAGIIRLCVLDFTDGLFRVLQSSFRVRTGLYQEPGWQIGNCILLEGPHWWQQDGIEKCFCLAFCFSGQVQEVYYVLSGLGRV